MPANAAGVSACTSLIKTANLYSLPHKKNVPAKKIEKDSSFSTISGNHRSLSLFFDYFSAIVITAVIAYPMSELIFSTFWALHQSRSANLPNIGTPFILSCTRQFRLWYRHLSTSLFYSG
jgi:hypothetical protein